MFVMQWASAAGLNRESRSIVRPLVSELFTHCGKSANPSSWGASSRRFGTFGQGLLYNASQKKGLSEPYANII